MKQQPQELPGTVGDAGSTHECILFLIKSRDVEKDELRHLSCNQSTVGNLGGVYDNSPSMRMSAPWLSQMYVKIWVFGSSLNIGPKGVPRVGTLEG